MDNAQPFGRWLKQRRNALDITQEQLSERVGCAPTTIRMIENGQRRPSRQIAELLADYFHVPDSERAEFLVLARATLPARANDTGETQSTEREARPEILNNLPAQPTGLLGRDEDLTAVLNLLLRGDTRLLTMTGSPGIGKTSLAIEAATVVREQGTGFAEGIFWVPLAPVVDPRMVAPAIAQVLAITETASEPVFDTLERYLKERHVLLVLDNFEHLILAASTVVELMAACPKLKMLVTSREALNVRGEREFNVPPLALPTRGETALEKLTRNPAVALFVERAQAADHTFCLSERNAEAVATLCARVDGVPLAIELIATRIKMMSPVALVQLFKVGEGPSTLSLLSGGARDLPDRHRTLRAAIAWSYDLLDTRERILLDRLGVFVGGFSLDAVEAVCNAAGDLAPAIEGLGSLLDKSLVKREDRAGREDEPRYTMLETIREFAAERLEQGKEASDVRQWHLEYYLGLARASRLQILGKEQKRWMLELDGESDNIRAALRWAIDSGALEVAAQMALALVAYWYVRGKIGEGHRWLEEIVRHEKRESLPPPVRAEALGWAGYLAGAYSDLDQAVLYLDESLDFVRQANSRELLGDILGKLGVMETFRGNYARAESLLNEMVVLYRADGTPRDIGVALHDLALLAIMTGDNAQAELLETEATHLLRGTGDKWHMGLSLSILGLALCRSGQLDLAESACKEALALLEGLESNNHPVGLVFVCLAEVAEARSEWRLANSLYRDALKELRETGSFPSIAFGLLGLGCMAAEEGVAERAATLFGAIDGVGAKLGMVSVVPSISSRYETGMGTARASLEEGRWAQAWARGKSMALDEVIAFALEAEVGARGVAV